MNDPNILFAAAFPQRNCDVFVAMISHWYMDEDFLVAVEPKRQPPQFRAAGNSTRNKTLINSPAAKPEKYV